MPRATSKTKKTAKKFFCRIETITPTKAHAYLKKMVRNRRLKKAKVTQYAQDIRDGRFPLTHEAIAFDVNGNLVDGQHRLHAVILAGKPIKVVVWYNLSAEAVALIDSGASRTEKDSTAFDDSLPNMSNSERSVLNALIDPKFKCTMSRRQKLDVWCDRVDAIRWGVSLFQGAPRPIRKAAVIAVCVRASHTFSRKQISRFVQLLLTEETRADRKTRTGGVGLLRQFLLDDACGKAHTTVRRELYRKTEYALFHYLKNKPLSCGLAASEVELFPLEDRDVEAAAA